MSCGCRQPDRTGLWTPIPDFTKPTEILPGENIECFAKRANDQIKDPIAEKPSGKIDNTAIVSDLSLNVNEQFRLTSNSTVTAAIWEISTDGVLGAVPPNLTFSPTSGTLSGTVAEENANKNYKILVRARDGAGDEIDSREFNFFPKKGSKDDTIKFVWPLSPKGTVTSRFGPRRSPTTGASSNHGGIDIANPRSSPGNILAAADGTVVRCGPGKGWGTIIMIEHRDAQGRLVATTGYAHWSESYVKVGQKVAAGQKIAKEGNEGVGTGNHLHFEMHKGPFKNPIDPLPYLNGEGIPAALNNDPTTGAPSGGFETISNSNRGLTANEANSGGDCPDELPGQFGGGQDAPSPTPTPVTAANPTQQQVLDAINQALDEDPSLTPEDKEHLRFVAKIESNFKPDAKNPASSARGLFQMLDKTANSYYSKLNPPINNPTIEQRNDPYLATKAQIEFYKREQKPYWQEFQSSGGTRIAGKTLSPEVQARYAGLSQGEFTYGLIHHDGVGNAVRGVDRQGVDYFRRRVTSG